jgi:hypothetical protein
MPLERSASTSSLIDVLDRVLDKGIIVDAWIRVSLVGIELVTVEARVVVASIATYLGYAGTLAELKQGAPAVQEPPAPRSLPGVAATPHSSNGHP